MGGRILCCTLKALICFFSAPSLCLGASQAINGVVPSCPLAQPKLAGQADKICGFLTTPAAGGMLRDVCAPDPVCMQTIQQETIALQSSKICQCGGDISAVYSSKTGTSCTSNSDCQSSCEQMNTKTQMPLSTLQLTAPLSASTSTRRQRRNAPKQTAHAGARLRVSDLLSALRYSTSHRH